MVVGADTRWLKILFPGSPLSGPALISAFRPRPNQIQAISRIVVSLVEDHQHKLRWRGVVTRPEITRIANEISQLPQIPTGLFKIAYRCSWSGFFGQHPFEQLIEPGQHGSWVFQ
jgi:hypothetical protein